MHSILERKNPKRNKKTRERNVHYLSQGKTLKQRNSKKHAFQSREEDPKKQYERQGKIHAFHIREEYLKATNKKAKKKHRKKEREIEVATHYIEG